MKISTYWKAVVAIAGAALLAAEAAIADLVITGDEWISIGIAVLTAVGVWAVPNRQEPGRR